MAEEDGSASVHPPLDIRDGEIHYRLYAQDGTIIPMTMSDTSDHRKFAEWTRRFDRYVLHDYEKAALSSTG